MTAQLPPADVDVRPPAELGEAARWIARAQSGTGTTADFWLVHRARVGEPILHNSITWTVTSVREASQDDHAD